MNRDTQRRVDAIRARSTEAENHLIDAYSGGGVSRREFVRRGTVLGMSLTSLGFLASACGSGDTSGGNGGGTATTAEQTAKVQPGGTFKAGINIPAGAVDPVTVADDGGLAMLGQTGEYLTWSDSKLTLQPRLAESWEPNQDNTAWTFKVRQGVKFHNGKDLTADDVVATFDRLADPDNASAALSAFRGVLSKGNIRAVDPQTVEFQLDAPNGNFPYLVSSDNYNTIVLPQNYDGDWEKTFIGTGPFKLERFNQGQGATFVKNPDYWDAQRKPNPDRTEIRFYEKEQARVLALQSGEVDAIAQFSVSGGKALLTDPNVQTIALKASTHRQVHMRTDREPFTDKRVRQAMALLVDRRALVDGLFEGRAQLGNDSPFSPVYKYTDTTVPQRQQDVERARALLADAGMADGFEVTIDTYDAFEMPSLAQLIQNDVKPAGIRVKLNIGTSSTYYGDAVFGKSRWLDSVMGITDYGHRGVVNVFLGAPLVSDGTWNAAHFRNKRYDRLVRQFTAQSDIDQQKATARRIQELLLDETPMMIPYFYDFLTGVRKGFGGVETTAMAHIQLTGAGQTV
ncbi:MAG TPA: ABC transporter substrate-binding protein [Solirubrobacteraceae bacterium]|nr:ABC transporter substrate-binding protein [Solirubrobacteraceae bacterium]